jgi:LysR family transcriptional regulator, hydrogen peroxide-inducible genes activator
MTLTELKYIVAVARERHFGKAADACFVSQPTLSVAIKKLEEELDLKLFERSVNEVTMTPLGEQIVTQAQRVLDEAAQIKEMAKNGKDPLSGTLRLGIIYTIAPYLLPALVRQVIDRTPQMPLTLTENFTHKLLEMLRQGQIDCAILAEPFDSTGLATAPLYDEPYVVAVPSTHLLAAQTSVSTAQLESENLLLLGNGHCFRDHVLGVCPEHNAFQNGGNGGNGANSGLASNFEGSSLETIRHMVAAGMGVTLMPRLSVPAKAQAEVKRSKTDALFVKYLPLKLAKGETQPTRRVTLAWRRSFTRYEAIAALRNAVYGCELDGVTWLSKTNPSTSSGRTVDAS